MATQTRDASSVVAATLYTGGASAYASDNAYAAWTSTSRSATGQLVLGIAAFAIPTGATINSVTVYVERKWSSGASAVINTAYTQIAYTTTKRGTQLAESAWPTADTVASVDGGTWTLTELNSGNMRVYFDTTRKNSTTSTTHSIDYVYVTVDYSPPVVTGAAVFSGAGALTAAASVLVKGAAVLSGSGALVGTGKVLVKGAAVLSGSGALTASGIRVVKGAAVFAGSGALTGDGTVTTKTCSIAGAVVSVELSAEETAQMSGLYTYEVKVASTKVFAIVSGTLRVDVSCIPVVPPPVVP